MRHIPVAEFKDKASHFFAVAEAGEELVVTRHGKPVVRISPVSESMESRRARARTALDKMAEHRATMRAQGLTATIEEMISWKNEGRR